MKEKRQVFVQKRVGCMVRTRAQDLCMTRSGASSLKSCESCELGDDVDYVTVKYTSTCRG